MRLRAICIWALFFAAGALAATPLNRGSLSLQTGVWKPGTLDSDPGKPFTPVEGTGLCWGVGLCSPHAAGFALEMNLWQWERQLQGSEAEPVASRLVNLAFDLKYQLLGATAIRPFVLYGGAALYGRPRRESAANLNSPATPSTSAPASTLSFPATSASPRPINTSMSICARRSAQPPATAVPRSPSSSSTSSDPGGRPPALFNPDSRVSTPETNRPYFCISPGRPRPSALHCPAPVRL